MSLKQCLTLKHLEENEMDALILEKRDENLILYA